MINSEQYLTKQKNKYSQIKIVKILILVLALTSTSMWSQFNVKTKAFELQVNESDQGGTEAAPLIVWFLVAGIVGTALGVLGILMLKGFEIATLLS